MSAFYWLVGPVLNTAKRVDILLVDSFFFAALNSGCMWQLHDFLCCHKQPLFRAAKENWSPIWSVKRS